jgi:hypothetical protein
MVEAEVLVKDDWHHIYTLYCTLIILLLPNVTKLSSHSTREALQCIQTLSQLVHNNSSYLPKLEHLHIGCDEFCHIRLDAVAPFTRLPRLKYL